MTSDAPEQVLHRHERPATVLGRNQLEDGDRQLPAPKLGKLHKTLRKLKRNAPSTMDKLRVMVARATTLRNTVQSAV